MTWLWKLLVAVLISMVGITLIPAINFWRIDFGDLKDLPMMLMYLLPWCVPILVLFGEITSRVDSFRSLGLFMMSPRSGLLFIASTMTYIIADNTLSPAHDFVTVSQVFTALIPSVYLYLRLGTKLNLFPDYFRNT